MEINIQATVGICSEFMKDDICEKGEVSVIISPLKINVTDDGSKMQVVMGCNLWRSCHNDDCWYSLNSREKKKAQPGK